MFSQTIFFYFVTLTLISAQCDRFTKNSITFEVAFRNIVSVNGQTVPVLRGDFFREIDNVKTLILSNDKIEKILPGTFDKLPLLKVLHIMYNNISVIEEGIFSNLELTTLTLEANGITNISPRAFDNMTRLMGIRITKNPLKHWDPNWFRNTPSLIMVNMESNHIQALESDSFKNFQGERPLNLNFDSNEISDIDGDAFRSLTKLTKLSFKNNRLEQLNGNFLKGVKIQSLDISDNKIRCIDDDDFEQVFVAKSTYGGGNPWDIDCLRKIKEWTKMNGIKVKTGRGFV